MKIWNWLKKVFDGNKTIILLFINWLVIQEQFIQWIGSIGIWGQIVLWVLTVLAGYDHFVKKKSLTTKYK